jgi:hypothetical protein
VRMACHATKLAVVVVKNTLHVEVPCRCNEVTDNTLNVRDDVYSRRNHFLRKFE